MLSTLLPLLLSLASILVLERAERVSVWIVKFAVSCLHPTIRDARGDQWLVDVHEIDGRAWKLLTAFGILWACKFEVVEILTGMKLPRRYAVVCMPTCDGPFIVMFEKKNMNPCGFVILDVILRQIEKHHGKERVEKLLESFEAEELAGNSTKWAESDTAFFTHVPPADVDIILAVVDGERVVMEVSSER